MQADDASGQQQQQQPQEQQAQNAAAGEADVSNHAQSADAVQPSTETDDIGELSDDVTVDALKYVC